MNFKKNKKILFITSEFPPGPGGIGNHAWNLAQNLNKSVQLDVLTISDYIDKNDAEAFDSESDLNIFRFKRYPFHLLTLLHRIYQIVKSVLLNKYTHCILSGYFSIFMSPMIKFINIRLRIIGVLHGSELLQTNSFLILWVKFSLKTLTSIISVSNYTKGLLPFQVSKKQKNIVIPNGVNNKIKLYSIESNQKISFRGSPCLLTVGSISHRKGQINLVHALPKIKLFFPDVHYHCVGLPFDKGNIVKIAKKLNVLENISFHGFIENNKLASIYKQADILIMLSQNKIESSAEGFGIAILEANLFGVPTIGSIKTGIEDAVENNKTGILVDPYSSVEIIDAMKLILDNHGYYGERAKDWASKHSWENIADKYLKVIFNG